jgi:multiple sugar transport system ATP-binding protein
MAEVTIRELRKNYGDTEVIHGVDVDIEDGQFVVLVGPSGCGKSTLLRMIAGLEEVTGGTIAIGDRVVNNLPPSERDIAMVFQNYALYPHKTVASNMAFSLRMRRMNKAEIKSRVDRAAEILGLTEYLGRYPRALSGGQRQRVAMGRAIVRDPQVFLFDEPLSNLDAKLRVQMRAEIRELHQRLATTTVYVTHDQIEAMTMADKIVVMQAGHIEQIGAPLELYDTPANTFVAGFIGSPSMNFFDGVVGATDATGGVAVEISGVAFSAGPRQGLVLGQRVTFGIRPEHLNLAEDGLGVQVAVVEPTGSETHVISRLGEQEVVAVFRERHALEAGQKITLRPDPEQVHLFDADTGTRLE